MNDIQIIKTEQALRKIIKPYPKMLDKRIQPALERYSLEFISHSRVAAIAFNDNALGFHYLDLKRCDFEILSNKCLSLSVEIAEAKSDILNNKVTCSLYFFIPGIGHGLRLNGSVDFELVGPKFLLKINVIEVYFHCARAIARSNLWEVGLNPMLQESAPCSSHGITTSSKTFIERSC